MLKAIDPRDEFLLAQLDRIQMQMEKAQREVSSGRRVNAASDAPDEISAILSLRASIGGNAQIRTNLERVKAEVSTADATLHSAVALLERSATLAVEGGGDLAEGNRQAIATEVRGLLEDLVGLSAATQGDRYLFSGDLDGQPCYRLNLAAPYGVDRLASPQATRQVQHPTGVSFSVALTAAEIFDPREAGGAAAGDNAFAAVNRLRLALEADDAEGIRDARNAVRQAAARINGKLGFYGGVENRIANALNDAGAAEVRLRTALADREDADVAASILELQQAQLNYSAALQARGSSPRTSLFDYLK